MNPSSTGDAAQDHAAQEEVFTFLADPATHGLAGKVARIDTHGAAVFLAGPDVYKVKRAVRFPFMDFSTLEKRRAVCEAEVAINRVNAPELYLGLVAITRTDGKLTLGGDGEPVEWAVHLRRFDENATLDRVGERGGFDADLVEALAEAVIKSHRSAGVRDGAAATAALGGVVEETAKSISASGVPFDRAAADRLARTLRAAFAGLAPLLSERGAADQVRRCHGDLHLRNIVRIDGRPVLFDALEFDETMATIDVLYDLAFLLMDLWQRGFQAEANLLLNRYLWACDDIALQLRGLGALPFFLGLRAAIRAKVAMLGPNADAAAEAGRYFEAAGGFLRGDAPCLVAVGGLSGSGKTTLASRIAPEIGRAPGAVHLRSDIERKRRFGVGERERLPPAAYEEPVSEAIYETLRRQAATALSAGHSVVVDAVHSDPAHRHAIAAIAEAAGVPFVGLWLDAPLGTLVDRVDARTGDASDATADVVRSQAAHTAHDDAAGAMDWPRLDASRSLDALCADALDLIKS